MGEQKYNLSYGFKVLPITTYKKKITTYHL